VKIEKKNDKWLPGEYTAALLKVLRTCT